jgi:hypothetical protein
VALVEVRKRVRDLTNHMQRLLSHVEDDQKPQALIAVADCMAELARINTLIANGYLEDSAHEVKDLKSKGKPAVHGG